MDAFELVSKAACHRYRWCDHSLATSRQRVDGGWLYRVEDCIDEPSGLGGVVPVVKPSYQFVPTPCCTCHHRCEADPASDRDAHFAAHHADACPVHLQ